MREEGSEGTMTSAENKIRVLGCPRCDEAMSTALIRFTAHGHDFGIFPGFKCPSGHRYLDAEAEKHINEEAAKKGIWG